jgi:hypothetical protein
MLIAALLLVGAYEAGHLWLGCIKDVGTMDAAYACSVTGFDIHHFDALLLLAGAVAVLLAGGRHS